MKEIANEASIYNRNAPSNNSLNRSGDSIPFMVFPAL